MTGPDYKQLKENFDAQLKETRPGDERVPTPETPAEKAKNAAISAGEKHAAAKARLKKKIKKIQGELILLNKDVPTDNAKHLAQVKAREKVSAEAKAGKLEVSKMELVLHRSPADPHALKWKFKKRERELYQSILPNTVLREKNKKKQELKNLMSTDVTKPKPKTPGEEAAAAIAKAKASKPKPVDYSVDDPDPDLDFLEERILVGTRSENAFREDNPKLRAFVQRALKLIPQMIELGTAAGDVKFQRTMQTIENLYSDSDYSGENSVIKDLIPKMKKMHQGALDKILGKKKTDAVHIPKVDPKKKKSGGGGRSRRKERCGKAPQGEYGSRRFKPRPNNLRSKARQEKYPEIKKIFDQFYADLDEFGVKIKKDFWWGSSHSKAYRKILCKLDEKSAKPKEKEAGPVDYQLANKYNANRQRLGVPILTGDQLKADYLNKLIRGGMHMGLTHEESDQLIGGRKKKGAEPVKQKQAKPKSLSGKEALVAYEHAMKIFNAADGFTDEDEENLIMMIVEKHLSEGTIGILFNMYSRVLRQKNASDRGDLVRELYHEDLTALAKKVRVALQRQTRGSEFREGKVHASKNKVVYAGKSMDLNKLIEHISNGAIKDYKSLKYNIRKKAIMESKNHRAVQSSKIADAWILNWLKENLGN